MSSLRGFSRRVGYTPPAAISQLMHQALARPELISLAAGFVDQQSLPAEEVRLALDALLADGAKAREALQYGTNQGLTPLREALLARFLAADGGQASADPTVDQVVLTAGSNQLLHLVGEVLLDPGDIVLCAAPCYFVFLGILQGLGARSVGVEIDHDGMIPAALVAELERRKAAGELERVKAIYLTSYYDNPSAVTISAARRAEIVEIAERWSPGTPIYVIDDAAYRELRYSAPDIPSLRSFDSTSQRVIVAETFSKSFSPGIRVGWGILPTALVDPVCRLKSNLDFGSPNFNQHMMSAVMARGLFGPHVAQLRAAYSQKLAAMLAAIETHLGSIDGVRWTPPCGGLYVWLELPESIDAGPAGSLIGHALDEGVLYVPGEYCFPAEGVPRRKNRIRLSFGVQSIANITRGIEALGRAIRRTLETST